MKKLLIIVLVTALAYGNIFRNGFVIDDQYFIVEKSANPVSQQGVFRPVRSLLYTTYFQIFGTTNPIGYHLHSLLVHLAATALVYLIISNLQFPIYKQFSKIQFSNYFAFVAALLFGLHPIHTESITYIAASMEMTGVVFMLASFYFYLRSYSTRSEYGRPSSSLEEGKREKYLSILFATLAFFTYEMTLTLPLLLILYEATLGKRGWRRAVPYWLAAAGFMAVRLGLGVGLARGDYLAYSFYHTMLTMTKMIVKYIWLLIWPVTLSHNQTVVPGFEAFMTPYSDQQAILRQSILDPEILFSIGLIGLICLIGLKLVKKHPLVSFGIGWFFISLLPVLYIFPQGTAFAEKYLYIASIGFVLVMSFFFVKLVKLVKFDKWVMIGVMGIALFYGVRTYLRNQDWQSPRTLWEHEAQIHPRSELAFYNLGIIYAENGEKDKAMTAYQKVLRLKPQFWQAENNLNNLLK